MIILSIKNIRVDRSEQKSCIGGKDRKLTSALSLKFLVFAYLMLNLVFLVEQFWSIPVLVTISFVEKMGQSWSHFDKLIFLNCQIWNNHIRWTLPVHCRATPLSNTILLPGNNMINFIVLYEFFWETQNWLIQRKSSWSWRILNHLRLNTFDCVALYTFSTSKSNSNNLSLWLL